MDIRILVYGPKAVGKTELLKRIIDPEFSRNPFNEEYEPTSLFENYTYYSTSDQPMISFWSVDYEIPQMLPRYIDTASFCLYCIDLSKKLDDIKIREDIKTLRKERPGIPIILVGTKNDQVLPTNKIPAGNYGANSVFLTSAKTGNGVKELIVYLDNEALKLQNLVKYEETQSINPIMNIALQLRNMGLSAMGLSVSIMNLYQATKNLPKEKIQDLADEVNCLIKALQDNGLKDEIKMGAIKDFKIKCNEILQNEYRTPLKLKAVESVTIAAVVTLFVMSAIFGVGMLGGFALGIPLTIAALSILATTSATIGASAGAVIGSMNFFKPTAQEESVNRIVKEAEKKPDIQEWINDEETMQYQGV